MVQDTAPEGVTPGRHSKAVCARWSTAETLPERYLTQVVEASVKGPYSPPTPEFIARAAVSQDEFMRKNPIN